MVHRKAAESPHSGSYVGCSPTQRGGVLSTATGRTLADAALGSPLGEIFPYGNTVDKWSIKGVCYAMGSTTEAQELDPLLLRHVAAQVDRHAGEAVHASGLTLDQWRALVLLRTEGAQTMAALTTTLGLTGPTATRVADHLTTTALAYREADATDRRRVVLRISRRGEDIHDELEPAVHAAQASVLDALDVAEQATLIRLLRKVLEREAPPATTT